MVTFGASVVPDEWLGHFDMLRDCKRNYFYAQSIQNCSSLFSDNVGNSCIDIGCGSGLLCCLVAKRLQKKCIAFEVDIR
jgi:predicted RNA methylase